MRVLIQARDPPECPPRRAYTGQRDAADNSASYAGEVRNRFPGKTCVLCPQPSEGAGEHVVPSWYIDEFRSEGPFRSENAGRRYLNRDDGVAIQQNLPVPHVPMRSDCNARLNTYLEGYSAASD